MYGKAITTDTASWWIKDGLSSAGVHTAVFKSHCGRSASSSKAQGIGIPVYEILKYYKRIVGCAKILFKSFLSKGIINAE